MEEIGFIIKITEERCLRFIIKSRDLDKNIAKLFRLYLKLSFYNIAVMEIATKFNGKVQSYSTEKIKLTVKHRI